MCLVLEGQVLEFRAFEASARPARLLYSPAMLRGFLALVVLLPATITFASLAVIGQLARPRGNAGMWCGQQWSRIMLRTVGARVTYEGVENSRSRMPCIFASNHESNVDIWAVSPALPGPTRFVAKKSLFRIPFLGWGMAAAGFIPIDRSNRGKAIRSLKLAAEKIRSGNPVILFPEGTRSREGGLQPFKKGPFHLALQARVPVVPVAITGSWKVMPPGGIAVRPGPVTVRFLPAVDHTEFLPNDHAGFARRVHEAIRTSIEERAR